MGRGKNQQTANGILYGRTQPRQLKVTQTNVSEDFILASKISMAYLLSNKDYFDAPNEQYSSANAAEIGSILEIDLQFVFFKGHEDINVWHKNGIFTIDGTMRDTVLQIKDTASTYEQIRSEEQHLIIDNQICNWPQALAYIGFKNELLLRDEG